MIAMRYLTRYLLGTLVFLCQAIATANAVTLLRISSSAYAEHSVGVFAWGGTPGYDEDYEYVSGSGTLQALASTMPLELHANASVSDPDAAAVGYGYNQARGGKSERTSARCFRHLWVSADPASSGAFAGGELQHYAEGTARWKIPETQTGDTWIQAKIIIEGGGWGEGPETSIHTHFTSAGFVKVADTELQYRNHAGGILVYGTLMDLDGPHQIYETSLGSVHEFTARQYIDPGVEFTTLTTHYSDGDTEQDSSLHIHTEDNESAVAGGAHCTTGAESAELGAFIGSP